MRQWSLALIDHARRPGIWSRDHYLDRMTFGELVVAYFQYYAIQAYLLLAAIAIGVALWSPPSLAVGLAAAGFAILAYPLIWYLLHRFVLHGRWMWKSKLTARTWKRIHYDHHQDPNHLEVLFGALYTTLPTNAVATIPTTKAAISELPASGPTGCSGPSTTARNGRPNRRPCSTSAILTRSLAASPGWPTCRVAW
jgi:hypothetical protein